MDQETRLRMQYAQVHAFASLMYGREFAETILGPCSDKAPALAAPGCKYTPGELFKLANLYYVMVVSLMVRSEIKEIVLLHDEMEFVGSKFMLHIDPASDASLLLSLSSKK